MVAYFGLHLLIAFIDPFQTWVATDHEFNSNQERLDYVNQAIEINLPPTTTVTRFRQEGFQDWQLDLEGVIPLPEMNAFIQSLPTLDQPNPNTYEGNVGSDWIRIEINPLSGKVSIKYISP